jgi:hypothetical protein
MRQVEPAEPSLLWAFWTLGLVTAALESVLLATGNDPLWAMPIVIPLIAVIIVAIEVQDGRERRRRAAHD